MENPVLLAAYYLVFLFSVTFHEAAHAWTALRLGDPTAYEGGQVSLDPRPHIRRAPFGLVVLPVIFLFLIGWPLGYASAPYDPRWAARHPHRAARMALAGPLSNLLLVVVAGLLVRAGMLAGAFSAPDAISFESITLASGGGPASTAALLLSLFFSLNLLLFVLNLIPLPPLDGSAAIGLLVDERRARRLQAFLAQPMFGMVGLLIAWRLFDVVFWPVFLVAANALYPGSGYGLG